MIDIAIVYMLSWWWIVVNSGDPVQNMLIGQFASKIGAKKRTAVPKKFRDDLGHQLIITRGYEGCLVLVDQEKWDTITKDVTKGSFIDKKIRDSGRFLLAGAHEVDLDTQGRFVIPSGLFSYGGFDNEAIFLGLVNWVEIWSENKWKEHETFIKENGSKVAQELAEVVEQQRS